MFEEYNICPYPGLRSFTEDESLYFKGRDKHIEDITDLLQKNKFLMVTGASGDGKSSVVFAGLIPNARAGFFRAKYNNWRIANFRPERSPLRNFSESLAPLLKMNEDTVQTELNRGFRSLVDLYLNSSLHKDANDNKDGVRENANLLIIVDQFEEFFTNSENFYDGAPAQDPQVLVNLLLETSRIALKEDLPIYVVFTMRSDFIGQCAAFRGLPEMIGFSQFFVPRLKRNELQQIIEEPAVLNGNSISRRLVERLLYDISEGIDQLPILQHTLNQIWHMADVGKEEMDLIHYAKVGGMDKRELPDTDLEIFEKWYQSLPEYKQGLMEDPSLNRVLDYHANELYEGAWDYYNKNGGKRDLSRKEVKYVIAMTFACLTKIDESRAVRNIMTAGQITDIISRKNIGLEDVNIILNYFREEGNTFLRPFILDDEVSRQLQSDTALDITHESLIRNWEKLKKWAFKEFEYFETWVDLQKQLQKWLDSGKDRGYLLPIGPLTFFENWYNECKPNKYWIDRYEKIGDDQKEESLLRSSNLLKETKEFLSASARKVRILRLYLKYGTAKIAGSLAVVLLIALSIYYFTDANRKLNSSVLAEVRASLMESYKADPSIGAGFISRNMIDFYRSNLGDLKGDANSFDSVERRIGIANSAYSQMLNIDKNFSAREKYELISIIAENIESDSLKREDRVELVNEYIYHLSFDYYFNHEERIKESRNKALLVLENELFKMVEDEDIPSHEEFNMGLNYFLTFNENSENSVQKLIDQLSPYREHSREKFERLFPVSNGITNGRVGPISHRGGYQLLAYLYAQQGDLEKVVQSTDSLIKYNSNYWQTMNFNNAHNILGYLIQFGHFDAAERYIDYLLPKSGGTESEFFMKFLDRSGFIKYAYSYVYWDAGNYHVNLNFMSDEALDWIFNQYLKRTERISDDDQRNFTLAIIYKQRGVYQCRRQEDKGEKIDRELIYKDFDRAFDHYNLINPSFLKERRTFTYRYYHNGFRNSSASLGYMFSYPDHFDRPWYTDKYISTIFMQYILDNGKFNELYQSSELMESINDWLANFNEFFPDEFAGQEFRYSKGIDDQLLESILDALGQNAQGNLVDHTLLELELAVRHFKSGNINEALEHYDKINTSQLQITANRWEYLNLTYIDNLILSLARFLAEAGDHEGAKELLEVMPNNNYKSVAYSQVADYLYKTVNKEQTFIYLDSAVSKGRNVDPSNLTSNFDYRYYLIQTLSGIGGNDLNEIAFNIVREMPVDSKVFGVANYILGLSWDGKYFLAREAIPDDFPDFGKLIMRGNIISTEANFTDSRPGWEKFDNYYRGNRSYIVFDANF